MRVRLDTELLIDQSVEVGNVVGWWRGGRNPVLLAPTAIPAAVYGKPVHSDTMISSANRIATVLSASSQNHIDPRR